MSKTIQMFPREQNKLYTENQKERGKRKWGLEREQQVTKKINRGLYTLNDNRTTEDGYSTHKDCEKDDDS